jgi:hypothetical protein
MKNISTLFKKFLISYQGDRTKSIGIVDSEYIVHYGLPTLGGSASEKVRHS